MGRIIVIEDNATYSGYVCRLLESKGFQTVCAYTCNGARKLFAGMREDDIVLADLRLNDGDGILLLEELRKQGKDNPYIIMTDYDEVPTAVKSIKLGAEEYFPKPLIEDGLPPLLNALRKKLERHTPIYERQSPAFLSISHKIRTVARTNVSVLILGENGTGKEHIAEKIHAMSKRAAGPFVPVDCGVLSKELAASDLFGHEKGAFTGAETRKKGFWEEADGGTLFLDEIGNLPPEVQQMMLRAIQSKRYRPVGSSKEKTADVRIVAATNEDLQSAIAEKRFREDLYHRVAEYPLRVPPLRECREDILPLADFFRKLANKEFGKQADGFDVEARERMLAYTWPGNVRELKGAVRLAVLFTEGGTIKSDALELHHLSAGDTPDFDEQERTVHRNRILYALEQAGGNKRKAAGLLGMSPTTFYKKMEQYGVKA